MRHLRAWAAGAIIAAIVIGCGPAKELPDEIPRSTDSGRGDGDGKDTVPEKSDPAALEIVERAIKTHTQNNPTLLEKGKLSKLTASGTVRLPWGAEGEQVGVSTIRTFLARWPSAIKWSYDFKSYRQGNLTLILRDGFTWWGENGVQKANLKPQKIEEDMQADGYGQHWLVLLFPLTESNTVVYGAGKGVSEGTAATDVVSVSIPGRPVYRLHFSPTSRLLVKTEYHYTDLLGIPALTEWILSDHQPYSGLILPKQIKLARTTDRPKYREVVQEWTVESWEFPDQFDGAAFDAPK